MKLPTNRQRGRRFPLRTLLLRACAILVSRLLQLNYATLRILAHMRLDLGYQQFLLELERDMDLYDDIIMFD